MEGQIVAHRVMREQLAAVQGEEMDLLGGKASPGRRMAEERPVWRPLMTTRMATLAPVAMTSRSSISAPRKPSAARRRYGPIRRVPAQRSDHPIRD
jgi:hypothetical protein